MHQGFVETKNAYQAIIDHLPMPVFLMDGDARIHMYNRACQPLLPPDPEAVYRRKFGEALHCIHSADGCGLGPACPACPVRDAVTTSARGVAVARSVCELTFAHRGQLEKVCVLVTASPMRFMDGMLHVVVLEDVTELHELRKVIPICASCKMIRRADGEWEPIESFLHENSSLDLTHGLCPACAKDVLREAAKRGAPPAEGQP